MNNNEKTTDDLATEFAASVAYEPGDTIILPDGTEWIITAATSVITARKSITELPEYIQSFLPHLIVKDEKKNGELQSESYYAFSPEMIRWVNENREAYSNCPTILLTCDELSKASLYYNSCAYESVPGEESCVLRFVIRQVEYPLHLSILIDDYLTACNIEGINPHNVAIGCCNRNTPFYIDLPFHQKIESL